MKNKQTLIIHPFLFGIYPVVFLFSKNVSEVPFSSMFIPLLITITTTLILMLGLKYLVKDRSKLGLILTGFWFYFFGYGNVYGIVSRFSIGGKLFATNAFLVTAWTVVFLIAVFCVLSFPKNLDKLTKILNVVAICLIIMCLINVFSAYNKNVNLKKQVADDDVAKGFPDLNNIPSELPDIYYIILDQRIRSDFLKEYFDYDDSAFLAQLADRGFYVADKSYSNYDKTYFSLPSALNCMYLDDTLREYIKKRSKPTTKALKYNRIFKLFKDCGYTLISFANGYGLCQPEDYDIFYDRGLSTKPILDEFTNELMNNVVITDVFSKLPGRTTLKIQQERILYSFDKIGEVAKRPSPHFVFCHILSPHPPFLFNENGPLDRGDDPHAWREWGELEIENRDKKYLAQLKFINKKTIDTLDSIFANSKKPPIIILQADHGIQYPLASQGEKIDYRTNFGILNAYYFPDSDYSQLYKSISPVNSYRVVLNQYFNANLELLEDRSYHSIHKPPFDFADKTEKINSN